MASAKFCCSPEERPEAEKSKANKAAVPTLVSDHRWQMADVPRAASLEWNWIQNPTKDSYHLTMFKFHQLLTLKTPMERNNIFIENRKYGTDMDWTFRCFNNRNKKVENVLAHKSILLKYSPVVADLCEMSANSGLAKNGWFPNKIHSQWIHWNHLKFVIIFVWFFNHRTRCAIPEGSYPIPYDSVIRTHSDNSKRRI